MWKTITLPKIKCFLWQCIHKSIPAREVLGTRGLAVPISCPPCNTDVESIINRVIFKDLASQKPLKVETLAKASEFAFLGLNERHQRTLSVIQVQWHPPPPPPVDWFKLNLDGFSLGNPGRAGGGGIIRNSRGEWVSGYARAIGHTLSVAAKLWALRDGINLCIALNLTNAIFELDAKLVVNMVQK